MYVLGIDHVMDMTFNDPDAPIALSYGDVFRQTEEEYSRFNFEHANTDILLAHFKDAEKECKALLSAGAQSNSPAGSRPEGALDKHLLALPAYDQCIKASHLFNLLDARGVISVTERQSYILRVRELAKACCGAWLATEGGRAE
jgi:glycyl-tRNA synthetase alpha chain